MARRITRRPPDPVTGALPVSRSQSLPYTPKEVQDKLLNAAGIDDPKRVELLKRVVESAVDGLQAQRETPATYLGKVMDVHSQPDHTARAKAREQLLELVGFQKDASVQAHSGNLVIPLPPWASVVIGQAPQSIPAHPTVANQPKDSIDVEVSKRILNEES